MTSPHTWHAKLRRLFESHIFAMVVWALVLKNALDGAVYTASILAGSHVVISLMFAWLRRSERRVAAARAELQVIIDRTERTLH